MDEGYKLVSLDIFIIAAFSFLISMLIIMCLRKRRLLLNQQRASSSAVFFPVPHGFQLTSAAAFFSERPLAVRGRANAGISRGPHTTSLNVQDWDNFRWILQLGPHIVAFGTPSVVGNQGGSPVSGDSGRVTLEEAKARREAYVHQCLIYKRVVKSRMPMGETSSTNEGVEKADILLLSSDEGEDRECSGNGVDESSPGPSCAICLKDYVVDDRICWSQNPRCCHHFHGDCIEEWLLKNDQCPFCRETYVVGLGSTDENGEENLSDTARIPRIPPLGEVNTLDGMEGGRVEIRTNDVEFSEMLAGIAQFYLQGHNMSRLGHPFVLNTLQNPDVDRADVILDPRLFQSMALSDPSLADDNSTSELRLATNDDEDIEEGAP